MNFDFLALHGITGGASSKKKVRELKKEIAHLTAVADITDRVVGQKDVYYDLFDNTNDMSCGQMDKASTIVQSISGYSLLVEDSSQFSIGQEVTIYNKSGVFRTTIKDIGSNAIGTTDRVTLPFHLKTVMARSTLYVDAENNRLRWKDWVDAEGVSHPMLEGDVRYVINPNGVKIGSIVTWVDTEFPTDMSNCSVVVTPLD